MAGANHDDVEGIPRRAYFPIVVKTPCEDVRQEILRFTATRDLFERALASVNPPATKFFET